MPGQSSYRRVSPASHLKREKKLPIRLILLFAFVLSMPLGWNIEWFNPHKNVQIMIDNVDKITISTTAEIVEDVIKAANIKIQSHDKIEPALDAQIEPNQVIYIKRAVPVTLIIDNKERTFMTATDDVSGLLDEAEITLGTLDEVSPGLNQKIYKDLEIKVVRVIEEYIEEEEYIPFKTLRWAQPELKRGQTEVIREGQEGIVRNTIYVRYEDNKLAEKEIIDSKVVRQAVDRIIGEGTMEPANVVDTTDGRRRYKEIMQMTATAYYPGERSTGEWADGLTFTGLRAERGIVAVDPTVIPLGTRLYIPGYGEALAADIGGAIKGNIIDLCFDSYEEAIEWGRQIVDVYILE